MRKNTAVFLFVAAMVFGVQTASAHQPREARVEVWTAQCHDEPWEDECVEVFLRTSERGYVTVYQVTPYGNVEVLYPQPQHFQRELRADRIYRLSDLADDVYLYDEVEGEIQIGVIYTPEPVALGPWLERSFVQAGLIWGRNKIVYARFDYPRIFARVEADIRVHIGSRCTPVFVVRPVHVRPRVIYRAPYWDRGRWKSHPDYKKRGHGRHDYDDNSSHGRKERESERRVDEKRERGRRGVSGEVPRGRTEYERPQPEKRSYERREPEVRRATYSARPAERKEEPVIAPKPRRERKEAPVQSKSDDNEQKRPPSRRGREARAEK